MRRSGCAGFRGIPQAARRFNAARLRAATSDDRRAPVSPLAQLRRHSADEWASWPDEKLLDLRMSQLGVTIEGSVLESRIAELQRELDARGLRVPAALLAVGRMVLARRRAGRRDPVLPRASAAREARARADARGRRGQRPSGA